MQVWNVLHAARWKCRTQKIAKNSPSGHHHTTLSGYIFRIKAHIDNRKKKLVHQQYLLHMSSLYGELRPTGSWDRSGSLGHPCKFQRVLRLGRVTTLHSSSRRQPNFAALNRGRHLYSTGQPSSWALSHISSCVIIVSYSVFVCSLVLWHCWLGFRKSIWLVKTFAWWDAGVVICLKWDAHDLHIVQLMPVHYRLLQ